MLSPAIVTEIELALARPKIHKYLRSVSKALSWLADLVVLEDLVPDTGRVKGVCRDPADDVVLAAAVEGRAKVIVTGDDDLLALGTFAEIAIVTPREFLKALEP